jgi:transposase
LDKTIFHGDVHPNTLKCPNCQSRRVIRFGQKPRVFKMLPVGRRQVELVVNIPRLYCNDCGSIRQAHLAFADPKKHYTRSLERFVIDLCRMISIQDVAELTGLGWDTVKEIHKRHLIVCLAEWMDSSFGRPVPIESSANDKRIPRH